MQLNLNKPDRSAIRYNFFKMPDGQPHIELFEGVESYQVHIVCSLTSMDDLGKLLVAVAALKEYGIKDSGISLAIPYFLGARQDRPQRGEATTLKIFTEIINNLNCLRVQVLHPHSDVLRSLLNNFIEIDHTPDLGQVIKHASADFLVIPDLGAAKNAKQYESFNLPLIQCGKIRDTKTGKLSGFRVYDPIPKGKGLIVDDICDGGGTFLGLAEKFDNPLSLYTTHGIYSKGFKELNSVFDNTYCTDSYHYSSLPEGKENQNFFYLL